MTQLGEATEIPTSDIDKSLDLEKFLKRNDSNFYLSIAEANFHVSFSSRFSRNGGKVPLSPLYFQDSRKISLSPLDFQDCGEQFLCILSIFKIFSLNILIINNFEKTNQILGKNVLHPNLFEMWDLCGIFFIL